ncbi:hypothetical protein AB0X39_22605 [Escherichia coli]
MSKLIRLATPADYAFNQDIGLWELAFDKRPVKGVRCNDPVDGAYEYNQGRLKFLAALDNTKKNVQRFDFEAVLQWAAQHGSPTQCQFVLRLLQAPNSDEYKRIALEFITKERENYPLHLDIAIFFTGMHNRLTTKHDLINIVKSRADYGKDS